VKEAQRIRSSKKIVALIGNVTSISGSQGDGKQLCSMLNRVVVHKASQRPPKAT